MVDIAEKYQWALDRIREAFPEAEIWSEVQDYGRGFSVVVFLAPLSIDLSSRGFALELEGIRTIGGVMQWMPLDPWDGDAHGTIWAPGPPFEYKIVGLGSASDPQATLNEWIASVKNRLALS